MEENVKNLEEYINRLWRGQTVNLSDVTKDVSTITDQIVSYVEKAARYNIEFPTEYIKEALSDFGSAIENRDDYKLADCLKYEWLEIVMVFCEFVEMSKGIMNE